MRAAAWLFLALAVWLIACDGDDETTPPTAEPTTAASPTPPPTALPEAPPFADRIGARAALPAADPIDLAARYGLTSGRAASSRPFAGTPDVGHVREFVVLKLSDTSGPPPVVTTISARLRARGEHAYFYVDESLGVDDGDVLDSAASFDGEVWPAVTGVFGEPPSPGVDGDPRIIVLLSDLGAAGGYHSADDLYLRAVRPLSNEAEMVYIDDRVRPGTASFDVVVAHELQHLVHDRNDPGEESWINEGLSETASGLVGGAVSSVDAFARRPETQLTNWRLEGALAHYGAGAAFMRYVADRYGGDAALGALARATADGAAGVEEFARTAGEPATFRNLFADWIAANALDVPSGRFAAPTLRADVVVERELAPGDPAEDEAPQFGTHYYALSGLGDGEQVLRFAGEASVQVLPDSALDGRAIWWSNEGDGIDTTLTCDAGELPAGAPLRLALQAWYDIEQWYDRGYVSISTDGGSTWRALPGRETVADDPVRLAYGPGFHGQSGGAGGPAWTDEEFDVTAAAGQRALIRFEYITDGSTHGEGFAVDRVRLLAGDEERALELGACTSDGWVRIDQPLAQDYVVRLIADRSDGSGPLVLDLPLDAARTGELRFSPAGLTDIVVAVAGATEGTNQPAPYAIELVSP